jgi:hypothetical protein
MTTSRIDRAQSAMIKSADCSTCKHRNGCDIKQFMNGWTYSQYDGTNCFQWEKWNASDAT